MMLVEFDDQTVIDRLGHRPELTTWVVPVRPPAVAPILQISHERCLSTFGLIDRLPAELLHTVLEQLDYNSLAKLARTCRASYRYIYNSYTPFDTIRRLAPEAVVALAANEVPRLHPVSTLYRALTSPNCACCGSFGAFLFLPTAQRACFTCAKDCRRFRLIHPADAARSLRLDPRRLEAEVPLLRIVPGRYWSGIWSNTRLKGRQLASLEHAVQLTSESRMCRKRKRGEYCYGSGVYCTSSGSSAGSGFHSDNDDEDNISCCDEGNLSDDCYSSHSDKEDLNCSQRSHDGPDKQDPRMVTEELRRLTDPRGFYQCTAGTDRSSEWTPDDSLGMATIAFPYIDSSSSSARGSDLSLFGLSHTPILDRGIWCKGCWHAGHAALIRRLTGGARERARKTYCLQEPAIGMHMLFDGQERGTSNGHPGHSGQANAGGADDRSNCMHAYHRYVEQMKRREHTREDFLEHVKSCPCLDIQWAWNDLPVPASLRERLLARRS